MRSIRLIFILALVVSTSAGGMASARPKTFVCSDGDWSDPNCWEPDPPGSSDDVVIRYGYTCALDVDAEINSFELGCDDPNAPEGGTLNIEQGNTLTVKADSELYGMVYLNGAGSTLRISPAGASTLTIRGGLGNAIYGQDPNAVITVGKDDTLATGSGIEIAGTLRMEGGGKFVNGYSVRAAGGAIVLATQAGLEDTSVNWAWHTCDVGGIIQFSDELPTGITLQGGFQILAPPGSDKIQIDQAIETTGRLRMSNNVLEVNEDLTMGSAGNHMNMTGGKIEVAAGKKFHHK